MSTSRITIAEVLARLPGAKKTQKPNTWIARCPAHDDQEPSLSITVEGDKVLLNCFAGCSYEAILKAMGLWRNGVQIPREVPAKLNTAGAREWSYYHADGRLAFKVMRWDRIGQRKFVKPYHVGPDGNLKPGMPEGLEIRPVLNLRKILAAPEDHPVLVVEGEKCVDVLEALGFLATTSAGGASAAAKSDWSWARDRNIVILPDNDEPGAKYARDVAKLCTAAGAKSVRIVSPSCYGAGPGGDVADVPNLTIEKVQSWIDQAKQFTEIADAVTEPPIDETGGEQAIEVSDEEKMDHHKLATLWRQAHPDFAWCADDWWQYERGRWAVARDGASLVKRQIYDIALSIGLPKITAHLVNGTYALAQLQSLKSLSDFEAGYRYLVGTNGTLDVETIEVVPHNPDHNATRYVTYEITPDKPMSVLWIDTLTSIFEGYGERGPELMLFLQEFAGYCLEPHCKHEVAVWLYGPPGTGKSTVVAGFEAFLGDLVATMGLGDIQQSHFALGQIIGKALVVSSEQPGDFVRSSHILNALISGEKLLIDRKFKDPIEVRPQAKLLWAMNDLPRIQSVNDGLFRRVVILECSKKPANPDPDLKFKLRAEASGILNWAIAGLRRIRERGFTVPESIRKETDEYRLLNDVFAAFFAECMEVDEHATTRLVDIYKAYVDWCRENGHQPRSKTSITTDLKRIGLRKVHSRDGNLWQGARLKYGENQRNGMDVHAHDYV